MEIVVWVDGINSKRIYKESVFISCESWLNKRLYSALGFLFHPISISTNIRRQWHLPRPDIHANLLSAHYRQSSMQRPLVSPAIRQQVLPIHDIAFNRPKGNARLVLFIAVYKLTPALIPGRVQDRKVCPPASDVVGLYVSKKGADAIPAQRHGCVGGIGEPVGVKVVALRDGVLDELDGLEVRLGHVEALEVEGAGLDAADDGVSVDGC